MDLMPAYVYGPAPEPVEKVAIPEGMSECDGTCRNGTYYGAGMVVNGHFVGYTGKCYRCGGKGYQTPSDVKRNRYYDDRIRRIPSL
jgi:hypothetical protein